MDLKEPFNPNLCLIGQVTFIPASSPTGGGFPSDRRAIQGARWGGEYCFIFSVAIITGATQAP